MGLPLLYGGWHCQYHKCLDADIYRVPSLNGLIGYLLVTMLCHDVLFYHAHRLIMGYLDISDLSIVHVQHIKIVPMLAFHCLEYQVRCSS